MKIVYIGKMIAGNYFYDENKFDLSSRISFADEDGLMKYLASPGLKKIRKRNNLVIYSSLEDNKKLAEALSDIGFKSKKIERI